MDYLYEGKWEELILEPSGDTFPIGAQVAFGGTTIPTNWLECNGQAVSRETYKDLFSVIGTYYGEGDGSTTFNLPDKRSRKSVGRDTSDSDFDTIGKTGGEKEHILTVEEMPKHKHTGGILTNNQTAGGARYYFQGTGTTNGTNFSNSLNIGETGEGKAHNNEDPYEVDCWIIKCANSIGLVGEVTSDINDTNSASAPNAKTVKEYVDNKTDEIVLYTNDTGSNGTITLDDDLSNYKYIEIFYKNNDGYVESKKVYMPNNKFTTLVSFTGMNASSVYVKFRVISMKDKTISTAENRARQFLLADSGIGSWVVENDIFILRVLGYK